MRVLIADDNEKMLRHLRYALEEDNHEVVEVRDGQAALDMLLEENSPQVAILDWNMPHLRGPEICVKLREVEKARDCHNPKYLILLTIRNSSEEIARGLLNGANDHMAKPFHFDEFQARVTVARRFVELQNVLLERVKELEEASQHIKVLQGLLPICMHCHKIKNDSLQWQKLEAYIHDHSEATLSHGLCPDCAEKYYPNVRMTDHSSNNTDPSDSE